MPPGIFYPFGQILKIVGGTDSFRNSRTVFDSDGFQFWASEAIRRGIPLTEASGLFTKKELKRFEKEAKRLNQAQRGDQACFYLIKK